MQEQFVYQWMTSNPLTVTPQTSIPQAHTILRQNKIRRLPVLQNNHLVGIITLGDLRNAEPSDLTTLSQWEIDQIMHDIIVGDTMTPDPMVIHADDTVGQAALTMLTYKIGGLPVVNDQNELVGIITESDIFRVVIDTWPVNAKVEE
ncbi:MAG TPA: CBS domain-containing protein [Anaerolineae bacterium]|nr:CBS domain-containing protein [Anaerolineae bacterium]